MNLYIYMNTYTPLPEQQLLRASPGTARDREANARAATAAGAASAPAARGTAGRESSARCQPFLWQ